MIESLITLIIVGHCIVLGVLFYIEECIFGKMGWQDNRFVERAISLFQGMTVGSCIMFITTVITW